MIDLPLGQYNLVKDSVIASAWKKPVETRTVSARYSVQTMQKTPFGAGFPKVERAVSCLLGKDVTSAGVFPEPHKTGINIAASLHFVAALPNTHYVEYCVEQGALRKHLTKQSFPVIDGDISVPEEPGLGVDLNEEIVAKYRVG